MKRGTRVVVVVSLAVGCLLVSAVVSGGHDPCAAGGCLGPNYPALVDTNENGRPDPGVDLEITIEVGPTCLVVNSPWDCDDAGVAKVINFTGMDMKRGDKLVSAERSYGGGMTQRAEIPPDSLQKGRPTRINFEELKPGREVVSGWAELVDQDRDGFYERGVVAREFAGGAVKVELNFIGADVDGDRRPDYVSIPWAQSDLVGVAVGDGCGPTWTVSEDPQVWVPLVDTDEDGAPDSIVADLDGDYQADNLFYWTPRLAMVAAPGVPYAPGNRAGDRVPPISQMGLGALLLGLAAGGWLTLRRRGVIG